MHALIILVLIGIWWICTRGKHKIDTEIARRQYYADGLGAIWEMSPYNPNYEKGVYFFWDEATQTRVVKWNHPFYNRWKVENGYKFDEDWKLVTNEEYFARYGDDILTKKLDIK